MNAGAVLLMAEADNVVIATRLLRQGETQQVDENRFITVAEPTPLGYKLAARDLLAGAEVIRCGMRIGVLTRDVAAGSIVHLHNLRSAYLPTYRRGEAHRSETA